MSPLDGMSGARPLYVDLVATAAAAGDEFDRHVFACAIAIAAGEARPPTHVLGLAGEPLAGLLDRYFPRGGRTLLPPFDSTADAGDDALEEPDLRQLLLDHRTCGRIEEEWLAAIVARRSLQPNHLWQDLGLFNRSDLSRLLRRHFEPLAARNMRDMKWKKFFYRELCLRDGVVVCKAPVCDMCTDFAHCFGGEDGAPLAQLARRDTTA